MRNQIFILTSVIFAFGMVQANVPAKFGEPSFGGSGCPAGSASLVVSEDGSEVNLLLDNMVAEAGEYAQRQIDRKSCNLSLPVKVTEGYSVAFLLPELNGYSYLPAGGSGQIAMELFYAGSRGPSFTKNISGPQSYEFKIDPNLATPLVWTGCGASVNLRINMSIIAKTNVDNQQSLMSISEIAPIKVISFRRCY